MVALAVVMLVGVLLERVILHLQPHLRVTVVAETLLQAQALVVVAQLPQEPMAVAAPAALEVRVVLVALAQHLLLQEQQLLILEEAVVEQIVRLLLEPVVLAVVEMVRIHLVVRGVPEQMG